MREGGGGGPIAAGPEARGAGPVARGYRGGRRVPFTGSTLPSLRAQVQVRGLCKARFYVKYKAGEEPCALYRQRQRAAKGRGKGPGPGLCALAPRRATREVARDVEASGRADILRADLSVTS